LIIEEFTEHSAVVGRKTDEPQWAKDLEKGKKWAKVTTSQDALYSFYCSEEEIESEAKPVELKEIEKMYAVHFPIKQEYKEDLTSSPIVDLINRTVAYPEKLVQITTAEQVNVSKEISSKLEGA
jgi:hypothetical protein